MSDFKIHDPHDVILAPVVSEKTYGLIDQNTYTFEVSPRANKIEIREAIEAIFGVKVLSVNTLNRAGKRRRTRYGIGRTASSKRAIVTLAADDHIDIFGNAPAE